MTAIRAVNESRSSRVLFLLALSVFINYLDRGNLSIAAPLLKNEFQLSATQLGVLLSSFFWTYSFFLPISGWLVDRLDVKWVLAGGFFLWSAATAATGLVHAFGTLILLRMALGAGESVSYPACSTILSRYLPEHKRGFANASMLPAWPWVRRLHTRWRNSDEPIWLAPGFSRGGHGEPAMTDFPSPRDTR
jgi:MFS family permease